MHIECNFRRVVTNETALEGIKKTLWGKGIKKLEAQNIDNEHK